jgi:hypothetical protein
MKYVPFSPPPARFNFSLRFPPPSFRILWLDLWLFGGDADVGDLVWDIGGVGIDRFGLEASSFPPPVHWESYVG